MAALDDIRAALAAALDITGLQSYDKVPAAINPPAAVVAPDSIEYEVAFDGGATYRLPVQFLVALGDWATAQRVMDGFVSHDGTAVEAILAADDIETRVLGLENYGLTQFANTDYLGAQVIVEVIL